MLFRIRHIVKVVSNSRNMGSSSSAEVILSEINNCGLITLNRPRALNSLNLSMVRDISPKMTEWAKNPDITHVIIEGAGDKAFCAGGDVVAVVNAAAANDSHACDFFREEYQLNYLIGTYPKPYIALLNGITMGGGVGLSIHGRFRVATERTLFAMPETGIGLIPDVGGGYFLPRLEKKGLGLYLALTGTRLLGADVLSCGIATHFTSTAHLEKLKSRLCELKVNNVKNAHQEVEEVLLDHHSSAGFVEPKIFQYLNQIESLFHLPNIPKEEDGCEWICRQLQKRSSTGDEWARMTLETLRKMSPLSMKVTLRQIVEGGKMDLAQVLRMEYRLVQNCLFNGDFPEGVRALLKDKDNKPVWKPNTLEQVSREQIERFFTHLEFGPEWNPK